MEDSFRVRVDKIFGSLASSSSSSSTSQPVNNSLWCLNDDEVEKIEWNRQKDSPDEPDSTPYPSSFDGFFADESFRNKNIAIASASQSQGEDFRKQLETDLQDLDDGDEDEDEDEDEDGKPSRGGSAAFNRFAKPDDHDDEEWDIRSHIGKDCTLDYEEEEDEYDKVAVGREKAGERLYMKAVRDDEGFEVPNSFSGGFRDPRANHLAAKLRLKQDAQAVGAAESKDVDAPPKSILKRKEREMGSSKSQKRVRFDSTCKTESAEESKDVAMEEAIMGKEWSSGVPDYIRNPSRYTHYTFDTINEMDEASNRQAYMDFLNLVRKSEEDASARQEVLPKSVTFTPRRKAVEGDALVRSNQEQGSVDNHHKKAAFPVGIAAGDSVQSEACAMEVEEEEEPTKIAQVKSSGSGRQYRVRRSPLDLDECVT
ncbi:tumor suppressing sub-chromosomal transferable candidate 4 [Dillenia turbinata]|uniref:U5 small nuclear ribonucleoprotein TSSC4 n=1 Tax=Dillenia turbinata TaxID=194707 RepID=A0AAN8ZCH2_9MAGN